jgi:tetratricopeptide (TPR) repeat protein
MLSSTVKAWILGLALAIGALGAPQRVEAVSRNSSSATTQRARRHFRQGKRAFEAKRYSVALKEFEVGYAIVPRPGFLLNMGHAARRMGDLRRARDYYLKYLESDPPAADRRSTIALVIDIDRQLAAAPTAGSRASASSSPTRGRIEL